MLGVVASLYITIFLGRYGRLNLLLRPALVLTDINNYSHSMCRVAADSLMVHVLFLTDCGRLQAPGWGVARIASFLIVALTCGSVPCHAA